VSVYWRNIYKDFIGRMEQRQMKYLPIYMPIYSRGSCMEIIKHAHIYSSNIPGFSAYWRSIYNDFMGHASAPVEQGQMEYTELNYFFGDTYQLPITSCLEDSDYSQNPQYQELNIRFDGKVL
jgi:hypothetical protein